MTHMLVGNFWECKGILPIDVLKKVSQLLMATLLHKLQETIKEKRRGMLSRTVRLLHDHASTIALAAIKNYDFKELSHPPYSPDLVSSDYYLFSKLKKRLQGKKFQTDQEMQKAVLDHFADKTPEYFFEDIKLIIPKSHTCIEIQRDYIEK